MVAKLEGKPVPDRNPNQWADCLKSQVQFNYNVYMEVKFFLPHYHCYFSFLMHWVRSHAVLEIVNTLPQAPLRHGTGLPLSGLVL